MKEAQLAGVLEAFAVGDAMGMPTEFMTRREIAKHIGMVRDLLPPRCSFHHSDLPAGSVTDDTEQNLYLLHEYCTSSITVESTVTALRRWIRETDAVARNYIGPSSLRALREIENGAPPEMTGLKGTTCGGIMRSLAPVLCCWAQGSSDEETVRCITVCLVPTHNTSQALEAACAYGFALRAALNGLPAKDILAASLTGAEHGLAVAPYHACAASSKARIVYLMDHIGEFRTDGELLDFLFGVLGTGLESADVCAAVFALFLYAKKDVARAICLAASVGGDTDTIAALVGALCTAYAGGHNIPAGIVEHVRSINHLDVHAVGKSITEAFGRNGT